MEVTMAIDPVIVLVEELRSAETTLRVAAKNYERNRGRERGEAVNQLLSTIKNLNSELLETIPTSALGAAELIRLVMERLPFSHARYADHFSEVARRLGGGQRTHADLVWLRAMEMSLSSSGQGDFDFKAAPLLHSAIYGASRPVIVFRAVAPARAKPGRGAMASPPN
jgi:hypothetical protein